MEQLKNAEVNNLVKEVDELFEKGSLIYSDIKCLSRANRIIESYNLTDSNIGNLILKMKNDFFEIEEKMSQKKLEMEEIRNKCDHHWVETGHDSHHIYYTCDICGKEERD